MAGSSSRRVSTTKRGRRPALRARSGTATAHPPRRGPTPRDEPPGCRSEGSASKQCRKDGAAGVRMGLRRSAAAGQAGEPPNQEGVSRRTFLPGMAEYCRATVEYENPGTPAARRGGAGSSGRGRTGGKSGNRLRTNWLVWTYAGPRPKGPAPFGSSEMLVLIESAEGSTAANSSLVRLRAGRLRGALRGMPRAGSLGQRVVPSAGLGLGAEGRSISRPSRHCDESQLRDELRDLRRMTRGDVRRCGRREAGPAKNVLRLLENVHGGRAPPVGPAGTLVIWWRGGRECRHETAPRATRGKNHVLTAARKATPRGLS